MFENAWNYMTKPRSLSSIVAEKLLEAQKNLLIAEENLESAKADAARCRETVQRLQRMLLSNPVITAVDSPPAMKESRQLRVASPARGEA